MVPKRIENGLKHLAPIIHARRQERARQGHEKPVSAVYFRNMFINIALTQLDFLTWLMDDAKGEETTDYNLTLRILSVNFAAIHASSMVND